MMKDCEEGAIARVVRHSHDERICVCRVCGGTGTVDGSECPQCHGSGRVLVLTDVTNYIRPYVPER